MSGAVRAPSVLRRLASMFYETLLLFAVIVIAGAVFLLANRGVPATGWVRHLEQIYFAGVLAAYFLYCWLRGGQTLAMKAWRIRLVAPGHDRVPAHVALLRFAYAAIILGSFAAAVIAAFVRGSPWVASATLAVTTIGLGWALVDRDRQFLYDRLAGTRLVQLPPKLAPLDQPHHAQRGEQKGEARRRRRGKRGPVAQQPDMGEQAVQHVKEDP